MTTRLKKLLKTLQNIKGSKKVATALLEGIRKLPVNISFFDMVNDKNEYLSFLPKNRIVGMERIEDEKGKLRLNSYKSPQRQEMRLGRIINRILPDQFTAKEIEDFVNEYKSEHDMITGNIGIRLVDGKEIAYWYDYRKYNQKAGGTLNNSCMRNVGKDRLSLYVDNPNQVKLAIYTRNNQLEARALVWQTDKGVYMDRIYYTQDHLSNAFQRYAENQGWKIYNRRERNMSVRLDNNKRDYIQNHPYLDTFQYRENGTLTSR
jgi:hypothetical protein